jgi:2-amino-4-hydroxy-6-hydroxymethyldihydropteridine diphosphokinase
VHRISQLQNTWVEAISKIYETVPVGYLKQPMFLNIAVKISTCIEPFELMKELHVIEDSLSRTREIRWGPRTIDIDILMFGERTINSPDLVVPHTRMLERAFVLIPLKDVCEKEKIKEDEIDQLINRCNDRDDVKFYRNFNITGYY